MVEKKSSSEKEILDQAQELKVSDQEIARKDKMERLAQENIDLFPHTVESTHSVFEIVEAFSSLASEKLEKKKEKVIVPGRVTEKIKSGRRTITFFL